MLIFSTERAASSSLNESPPEKEGKYLPVGAEDPRPWNASMKALPKRKGNVALEAAVQAELTPQ